MIVYVAFVAGYSFLKEDVFLFKKFWDSALPYGYMPYWRIQV